MVVDFEGVDLSYSDGEAAALPSFSWGQAVLETVGHSESRTSGQVQGRCPCWEQLI